jgi:hypothetical protein
MSSEPRKFDYWWRGAPLVQNANTGTFMTWWKGAPVLQKAPSLFLGTQVGSGGVTIGGSATVSANVSSLQYGGVVVGGAAATVVKFQTRQVGIVIDSYVGDGTGARSIADVTPARGLCVMVMGIDGSNNEIGAVRIAGMPAGKSHPWTQQPTTSDPARDDRITSIDLTGFSVGTDLNQNGLVYTYIIWPYLEGVTAAGSWDGSGDLTNRLGTTTLTISGSAASGTSAFLPGDVGKVLYDVDADAAIGTITGYTNSSNVTVSGGVNGSYSSGHWSVGRKTLASIGFVPDLVIVVADQTLPDAGVSELTTLQISPGLFGDMLGGSGTDQNFASSGANPALIAVYPGTSSIVAVANGSSTGYDDSGVTFRWFAIKAVTDSAFFDKIDYTGDGAGSLTLSGLSFAPEFAIFTGRTKVAGWKPLSTAALPAAQSSVFNDGGGEETSNITLTSDGATFGSSNSFNTIGVEYRAYFLKPGVATTGGVVIGGEATVAFSHVVGSITGSGGVVIGGAADVAVNRVVAGEGGIVIGGEADVSTGGSTTYTVEASGGVVIGGAADVVATFTYAGSGGVVVAGEADVAVTFNYSGSGGVVIGGEADVTTNAPRTFTFDASGGIVVGGAATVVYSPATPPAPPRPVTPGAVGGADLVRQPFWSAPGTRLSALIIEPAACVDVEVRTVEDELSSEENQLLGLL